MMRFPTQLMQGPLRQQTFQQTAALTQCRNFYKNERFGHRDANEKYPHHSNKVNPPANITNSPVKNSDLAAMFEVGVKKWFQKKSSSHVVAVVQMSSTSRALGLYEELCRGMKCLVRYSSVTSCPYSSAFVCTQAKFLAHPFRTFFSSINNPLYHYVSTISFAPET